MKKLLAVILVLGMASIANAGLILSVNGEPAPAEITMITSEVITLDILLEAGTNMTGGQLAIELSNAQGELTYGPETFPSNATNWMFDWYTMGKDAGYIEITGGDFSAQAGPLVILDQVFFHCLEETDVIISLHVTGETTIDGQTVPVSTILDSIIVHQIPEPMTVALLGLGGLFLIRRRK